ncbi:MAG: hypothetical protein PHN57_01135 [Candidatus Omnitrophica bacterium]|nr:hypothetical protein [Candidatus Omnitrophota bacterium]
MAGPNTTLHPGTAAVLSFVFNGLGQLYNGQIKKGLVIIFFSALSLLVFLAGSIVIGGWFLGRIASFKILLAGCGLFFIGLIVICAVGIYSIVDAYKFASKK